jgi:hypothetical protein
VLRRLAQTQRGGMPQKCFTAGSPFAPLGRLARKTAVEPSRGSAGNGTPLFAPRFVRRFGGLRAAIPLPSEAV